MTKMNHSTLRVVLTSLFLALSITLHAQKIKKSDYQQAVDNAYEKYKTLKEGKNADYIKELANVDPDIYGIAIVTADGKVYSAGD